MTIVGNYAGFILNVVDNPSLHQEDAVFVQCPHELLPSIDFILDVGQGAFKNVESLLVL